VPDVPDERGTSDVPDGEEGAGSDVVVVSYRSAADLAACLGSVLAQEPAPASVTVVDNGSDDGSVGVATAHGGVDVIALDRNIGFAAAANRGVAAGSAPSVLVLNPDAVLAPGALAALRAALAADPGLAAVTASISDPDGSPYPSARRFPSLPTAAAHAVLGLVRPANRWSRSYLNPTEPDWIAGTAFLARRAALEAVGGFDERYFMYVEDVDLCWRWRQGGWRVGVARDAAVTHRIGGSTESVPYRMIVEHHRSLWRFAVRTRRGPARLALPLVAVGLVVRAALAAVLRTVRRRPPAAMHGATGRADRRPG
jgi:N-acetylglucosaminyl-diphospho-decaprenol L-rhamnosyltransferase